MNIGRTCRLIEEIYKNEIRLTLPSNKKNINIPMKTYLENIMDKYLNEFVNNLFLLFEMKKIFKQILLLKTRLKKLFYKN